MDDVEIIGMLRTFVTETLVGMGALKGAPCTVKSITDNGDGTQTLTLEWVDTAGVSHTTDIDLPSAIFDFTNLQNGQTMRYNSTSGKWENSNVSFSADLGDLDDVTITSVSDGQVIKWSASASKWINATLAAVASSGDYEDLSNLPTLGTAAAADKTSSVTEDSEDVLTSGGAFTALAGKADTG